MCVGGLGTKPETQYNTQLYATACKHPMSDGNDTFGAVPAVSSSDGAHHAIRRAILDGKLRPGDRIVEQKLAAALEVSRTPVREALHKLERENLVAQSGRGMVVQSFTVDDVRVMYDLRARVEGYAAHRAAERITALEIAGLRAAQDQLTAAVAGQAGDDDDRLRAPARLNQHFHRLLVRAARSEPLERTVVSVSQTPLIYKAYLWYGDGEKERSARDHVELIEHLAARDAEAAEATWRRHMEFGRDILVRGLLAKPPDDDAGY